MRPVTICNALKSTNICSFCEFTISVSIPRLLSESTDHVSTLWHYHGIHYLMVYDVS